MNLIADERRETALARPVITLRVEYAANPNPQDEDAEFVGQLQDECAALMSLILGIRLQASGKTRFFNFAKQETLGDPRALAEVETPVLLPGAWTPIIAHAQRTVDLTELALLESYPRIEPRSATALTRAARLYQEALWLSEREAWLTWLLLVSAVETAANEHKYASETPPADLLRELDPRLANVAMKYGDACVKDVAETQVKRLGATKKFLGFLQTFMPDPPEKRPTEYRLEWTWAGLSGPLNKIYDLRSKYLHAGVPFPWQLRVPPTRCEGIPTEQHPDHIKETHQLDKEAHHLDGTKVSAPMHVHVFEHITRGALLRWWRSLVSPTQPTSTSE